MSATLPAAILCCPDCRAENPGQAMSCWLCHRQLRSSPEVILAELVPERTAVAPAQRLLAGLTALIGVVVILLGIGIAREEPFLLIPYTIVVGLGLAITSLHEVRVRASGRPVGWGERLLTFIISVNAVLAVLAVIAVAAVVAFVIFLFLVCSGALR